MVMFDDDVVPFHFVAVVVAPDASMVCRRVADANYDGMEFKFHICVEYDCFMVTLLSSFQHC
jgi:hypothetical protein